MNASLVHAHQSRIHFILDEIREDIAGATVAVLETGNALDLPRAEILLAEARLSNLAVMERIHEVANEVAILREMMGIR